MMKYFHGLAILSALNIVSSMPLIQAAEAAEVNSIETNKKDVLVTVGEFSSLDEAFTQSPNAPFIVRNAPEFVNMPIQEALLRLKASPDTVFGYDDKGDYVEHLKIARLVNDWELGQLNVKILDSFLHVFDLPLALTQHHSIADVDLQKEELGQTVILSRANGYTPLHMDPPSFGGGWMYLWQGQKDWHFLSPEWMDLLLKTGQKKLVDASPEKLAEITSELSVDVASVARFHSVRANAGDFVYFPPGWMHRVWTYDKSIGLGGYIRPEATQEAAKVVDAALAAHGLNAIWK